MPALRPAVGVAGGFNAVQKLLTNRGQRAAGKDRCKVSCAS
jgi:hypothetical protein